MKNGLLRNLLGLQGYQWHKDKVQSEDGKKQQAKVWTFSPSLTSWAALWHSLLLLRHCQPWTLQESPCLCPRATTPQTGLLLGRGPSSSETPLEVWVFIVSHQFSLFFLLGPSVVSPQ